MVQDTSSATIEHLIEALSSFNDFSRVEARKTLVGMGSQAVPFLVETLKDPNYLRRWEAAKALGEIGDPRAAPALVMALEDEAFDVRWLAAKGLIELNVKGLKPLLQALVDRPNSGFLRQGAHHVLHDLAKGELRIYLAPMLIALESVDSAVLVPTAAAHTVEELTKAKLL